MWIPAQSGLTKNEEADALAKLGTNLTTVGPSESAVAMLNRGLRKTI